MCAIVYVRENWILVYYNDTEDTLNRVGKPYHAIKALIVNEASAIAL